MDATRFPMRANNELSLEMNGIPHTSADALKHSQFPQTSHLLSARANMIGPKMLFYTTTVLADVEHTTSPPYLKLHFRQKAYN